MNKKLNIGCGTDYRKDFINIDGSSSLQKVDKVVKIPEQKLLDIYGIESINYILCNDFLEHHFHFEAISILEDFFSILEVGGNLELRVPDCDYIISETSMPIEMKLTLLFGGQDIPQGNIEMDESRKIFPQFFCHKYGWNKERISRDMISLGYQILDIDRVGTNIIIKAMKKR